MSTLFMTRGLPASGKSTWAHEHVRQNPGTVQVSKDDLRLLPDAPKGGRREWWVIRRRDEIVASALAEGRDVIVHDTNLNPIHERRLRDLAAQAAAAFQVVEFDVDVLECIDRDARRAAPVGAKVIWTMWQKWVYLPPAAQAGPGRKAVLVDIDGTLARMRDRGPYDWDKVATDAPVPHVVDLVRSLANGGYAVVYVSGRDGSCHDATQKWIAEHVGIPGPLLMRAPGDRRKDSEVKAEIYREHLQGRYAIQFVLDDRDQVVHMWRTQVGVPCLQVEYGHF